MNEIRVSILKPFRELREDSDLVVFKNERPYISLEESVDYLSAISDYARKNRCFLVSSLYEEKGYLNLCIIDREGELVGKQGGICLNTRYLQKLKRQNELNIIETDIGKIFLAVDVDIYRPEVIRLAVFRGCDIIISSQFFHDSDFSVQRILFGSWSESQANNKLVINTSNMKSSIIAPCALTKDLSGFLKQPDEDDIYGEIDILKAKEAYVSFPVFDTMNPMLYRNNYKELAGK